MNRSATKPSPLPLLLAVLAGLALALASCGGSATADLSAQDEEGSTVDAPSPDTSDGTASSETSAVEATNSGEAEDATAAEPAQPEPGPDPQVSADDIPLATTPPGGYGTTMPPPILADCTEPLSSDAADLRGMWQIVGPETDGDVVPVGGVQRVEQCGNRLVITSGGVIHDMRVDGTLENGVNDVAASDFTTPVRVAASWEDNVHILRPEGLPIEVTRHLDGDQLIWRYFNFAARLDRIGPPEMDPPASSSRPEAG